MALRKHITTSFASSSAHDAQTTHQAWSALIAHSNLDQVASGYRVWVDVSHSKKLAAFGESPDHALSAFCREVSDFVSTEATGELLGWLNKVRSNLEKPKSATKAKQKTVGVSSKASLLHLIAEHGSGDRAGSARELFITGFRDLDKRLDNENQTDVFNDLNAAYDALPDSPTEQWMLRLDSRAYGRLVVRAGEYGKSASNLAARCLAYALRSKVY